MPLWNSRSFQSGLFFSSKIRNASIMGRPTNKHNTFCLREGQQKQILPRKTQLQCARCACRALHSLRLHSHIGPHHIIPHHTTPYRTPPHNLTYTGNGKTQIFPLESQRCVSVDNLFLLIILRCRSIWVGFSEEISRALKTLVFIEVLR